MIAASQSLDLCVQCGSLIPLSQSYEGWCFSCVIRWGHPDDAADVARLSSGWEKEASAAAVLTITGVPSVSSIKSAAQSLDQIDAAAFRKKTAASLNIERYTTATASDGFLYDDEPSRRGGRWSQETKAEFIGALTRLFAAGMSNRSTARVTGISLNTIAIYRRKLSDVSGPCECGKPATHNGWCRQRFYRSRRRQEFMASWHPRASWPYISKDGFLIAWGSQK